MQRPERQYFACLCIQSSKEWLVAYDFPFLPDGQIVLYHLIKLLRAVPFVSTSIYY